MGLVEGEKRLSPAGRGVFSVSTLLLTKQTTRDAPARFQRHLHATAQPDLRHEPPAPYG